MDCTSVPLEHLELTIRKMYHPSKNILLSADSKVFYMDCTSVPLAHLELIISEVFQPGHLFPSSSDNK